ncbi:MAG TPA: hypothetical protein VNA87_04135 [Actinomycetota bacterium]|nr:hypothetical protein [Actinomycetota bacterium]
MIIKRSGRQSAKPEEISVEAVSLVERVGGGKRRLIDELSGGRVLEGIDSLCDGVDPAGDGGLYFIADQGSQDPGLLDVFFEDLLFPDVARVEDGFGEKAVVELVGRDAFFFLEGLGGRGVAEIAIALVEVVASDARRGQVIARHGLDEISTSHCSPRLLFLWLSEGPGAVLSRGAELQGCSCRTPSLGCTHNQFSEALTDAAVRNDGKEIQ